MPSRTLVHDPDLARLIERQMRNWELARDQRHTAPVPQKAEVEEFLCISRQVGTDGSAVAAILGRRLGWPVFGREILEAMAGDDEVRRQIYESMDQRDLSWWEEALRALMQSEFVRNDYFKRLSETLFSLARQSNCVFVGRGADLLLPAQVGFRARLVAPAAHRAETLTTGRVLTLAEARQLIERVELDRQRFFRRHFGVDANAPARFDITINMARFSLEEAAEVILQSRSIRQSKLE
jgi:cytidylate kinase